MLTAKLYGIELVLEAGVWGVSPDSPSLPFAQDVVEMLQLITDPNNLSGADPDPDLAHANHAQAIIPALTIVSHDSPEFDPQAIY